MADMAPSTRSCGMRDTLLRGSSRRWWGDCCGGFLIRWWGEGQRSAFSVQRSAFRAQGSGLRAQGSGLIVRCARSFCEWAVGGWLRFCGLFLHQVFGQEEDVGGALGEAAHEVGVPLGAEWGVDAEVVAFCYERALEVAADSVQHLELEAAFGDGFFLNEAFGGGDHGWVVGGDAVIDSAGEQSLGEADVVGVYVGLLWEGHGGRLFVGSFAEAQANALGDE